MEARGISQYSGIPITKDLVRNIKFWTSPQNLGLSPPDVSDMSSLVAQLVKNLPAMQETWVQFLGQEDTLEKEIANHSSILAWTKYLMDRGDWKATIHRVARAGRDLATNSPLYCHRH